MLETTNATMQHAACEAAMRRNPCECPVLACDCPDRVRSTRLVDYARFEAGEARRAIRTDDLAMQIVVSGRGR